MMRNFLSQKMLQKLTPQQIQIMKLLQVPTAELEQRIQEELEINPALEELDTEKEEYINEVSPELKDSDTPQKEQADGDDSSSDYNPETEKTEDFTDFDDNGGANDFDDSRDNPQYEEYLQEYINDDTPSYKLNANLYSPDEEDKSSPVVLENSFYEYMQEQLHLLELDELEKKIALQIIGSLNEDGYLTRDVEALSDDLLFAHNLNVTIPQIEKVLKQIQSLDPAGIASQNLQECLAIQLRRKLDSEEVKANYSYSEMRYIKLALAIVTDFFDEFSRKHFPKLLQSLNIEREELKDITKEILKLNPKPGSAYASASKSSKQYITPDFTITNNMGELELALNSRNAPDLRVNDHYKEMLQAYQHKNDLGRKEKEAVLFVRQKIDAARWFIDAIRQRQATMLMTMQAIMVYQKDYLLTGDERYLKPMILKDVSDLTGLDISTISRVVNEKYAQTEFGIKRLRDFFSEGITNDEGDEVSTAEIKQLLQDYVQQEDKQQPLSDEKLRVMLAEKGFSIARRTVAKYREELGIAVARMRKEL